MCYALTLLDDLVNHLARSKHDSASDPGEPYLHVETCVKYAGISVMISRGIECAAPTCRAETMTFQPSIQRLIHNFRLLGGGAGS